MTSTRSRVMEAFDIGSQWKNNKTNEHHTITGMDRIVVEGKNDDIVHVISAGGVRKAMMWTTFVSNYNHTHLPNNFLDAVC